MNVRTTEKIRAIERAIQSTLNYPYDKVDKTDEEIQKVFEFAQRAEISGLRMAEELLSETYSDLGQILSDLGEENETYRKVSTTLVNASAESIYAQVLSNSFLSIASDLDEPHKRQIRADNGKAALLLTTLEILYMDDNTKALVNKIKTVISASESRVNPRSSCYVATIIYRDHDCHAVFTLRAFRDNELMSNLIGRVLVKCYYLAEPIVRPLVQRSMMLQRSGRWILDNVIGLLHERRKARHQKTRHHTNSKAAP